MRVYLIVPLVAIALSGAVAVSSDNPSDDIFGPFYNGYTTACKYTEGNLLRVVGVHYVDETSHVPCEVRYHKPTEHPEAGYRVLWHAHRTEGYCERKAKLLVNRLEGWGWQCGEPVWYEDTAAGGSNGHGDHNSTEENNTTTAPGNDCTRYGGYYCD